MTDWVLAIETVATAGSVALLQTDHVVEQRLLPPDTRSARTLAKAVSDVWTNAGKPAVSLVAVASGPGSFTGLRVGITTAKALAYAWKAKLVGISTLDAIAAQAPADAAALQVVLEAQRKELFVATYENLGRGWQRFTADAIASADHWLASLVAGTLVSGPPMSKLNGRLTAGVLIAPESDWQPRAATIGRLALQALQSGASDELWSLTPRYLRASYAEEVRSVRRGQ
jgi:tRNA threonylcarbamoyladenosine biosynthesis protein TsaB